MMGVLKISEETLKRISALWKKGVATEDIGVELNISPEKVQDSINQMLVKQSCRMSPNQKPDDNLSHATVRECISCHNEFWSPHRRQIHMCDVCKSKEYANTDAFDFAANM